MFCIKIAGIPIGIDNRESYIERLCDGYEIEGETPDFTVHATEQEVRDAWEHNCRFSYGYLESLCLYRKICLQLARYQAFLMHAARGCRGRKSLCVYRAERDRKNHTYPPLAGAFGGAGRKS